MADEKDIVARPAGPVWVGVDRSSTGDTYCECRFEPDGTITVLDVYALSPAARSD